MGKNGKEKKKKKQKNMLWGREVFFFDLLTKSPKDTIHKMKKRKSSGKSVRVAVKGMRRKNANTMENTAITSVYTSRSAGLPCALCTSWTQSLVMPITTIAAAICRIRSRMEKIREKIMAVSLLLLLLYGSFSLCCSRLQQKEEEEDEEKGLQIARGFFLSCSN